MNQQLKLSKVNMEFFNTLFNENENVCFGRTLYDTAASPVNKVPRNCEFFTLNPIRTRRKGEDVTAFRNILIELDKDSIKKQLNRIKKIGVPYTSLVFSGGKSIHCIISLEQPLKDREEFTRYILLAWTAYGFKKIDKNCKDPARFTRFPNSVRVDTGKIQELLELKERIPNELFLNWCKSQLGSNKFMELYYPPIKPIYRIAYNTKLWMSKATTELIENGTTNETSRHEAFVKAVVQLKKTGYEDDNIYELLANRFEEMIPERNIRELKDIIKWAKNIQPEEE